MKKYWPLFLISLSTFVLFTMRLGRNLYSDWDECLYGQYSVEMLKSGHYLTNIWNQYIDLQKPPLYTWILAAVNYFNGSEFALRMVSVTGAIILLNLVYLFAAKYFSQKIAVLATLILLTGEVFVIYALKLNTDLLFSLIIFSAVWQWWRVKDKKNGFGAYGVGALFGLAVMIKGLGSLQFIMALGAATILFPSKVRFANLFKLGIAFALIIIPWHLATYMTYGSHFIKVYIFDNIIKRSMYPIENHRERIWFYFVLLYRELKPWIFTAFVFPIVLMHSFITRKRTKHLIQFIRTELKKNELILTVLICFVVPLISITRVQTRIAWYALPLYPFIAIYLAYNLNILLEAIKKKNLHLAKIIFAILVIFLSVDAFQLIRNEVRPLEKNRFVDPRNQAILQAQKQPDRDLYYLVTFGERQGKAVLPLNEQIDMTWVYGGNPCAVHYSKKKVHYIYTLEEFSKVLKSTRGLFLIQNGDLNFAEGKKIIFSNNDFTLFRQ